MNVHTVIISKSVARANNLIKYTMNHSADRLGQLYSRPRGTAPETPRTSWQNAIEGLKGVISIICNSVITIQTWFDLIIFRKYF